MPQIIVKYSEIDMVVMNIKDLKNSLETEKAEFVKLMRNIANYNEWRGAEKGKILSTASGAYYNYFNSFNTNVGSLGDKIKQKADDFSKAEE